MIRRQRTDQDWRLARILPPFLDYPDWVEEVAVRPRHGDPYVGEESGGLACRGTQGGRGPRDFRGRKKLERPLRDRLPQETGDLWI